MLMQAPFDYGSASITYEQQVSVSAMSGAWSGAVFSGDKFIGGFVGAEVGFRLRLDDLRKLLPNWDGEGADSLSELTLRNARDIAFKLSRYTTFPEITPNAGDTLTFEWETDAGVALMEIGHDAYSFLMKTKAGKRLTDTGRLDSDADIEALGAQIQRGLFQAQALV